MFYQQTKRKILVCDNKKGLDYAFNYDIGFTVRKAIGKPATGVFDIYLNQAPKKVKASTLTPSNPKQTPIGPSNPKWKPIGPSNPKASVIGPSKQIETAKQIAAKLSGKTIITDPNFWLGKDIKKYHDQLANAIVQQGILTKNWGAICYLGWLNFSENYNLSILFFYGHKRWIKCGC